MTPTTPGVTQVPVSALVGFTGPRTGSKTVVTLLQRDSGARIDELASATQWLPHTTRAALTGLRLRGYGIGRRRMLGWSAVSWPSSRLFFQWDVWRSCSCRQRHPRRRASPPTLVDARLRIGSSSACPSPFDATMGSRKRWSETWRITVHNHCRRKRRGGMASAFENRRLGRERP
jgi:Protein of unknown function (DUF3489)